MIALGELRAFTRFSDPAAGLGWALAAARLEERAGHGRIVGATVGRTPSGRPSWSVDLEIPAGHAGTDATIRWMVRLAREWSQDPRIIELARRITAGLPGRDERGQADALFRHVRDRVRYVKDPEDLEHLQTPTWTALETRAEDCDGQATLVCALALALGMRCAYRTVGREPGGWFAPARYRHVYPMVEVGGAWRALDTTVPGAYPGWEPGGLTVARTWRV